MRQKRSGPSWSGPLIVSHAVVSRFKERPNTVYSSRRKRVVGVDVRRVERKKDIRLQFVGL